MAIRVIFPLHCNNLSDKYITLCKRFGVCESEGEDKQIHLFFGQRLMKMAGVSSRGRCYLNLSSSPEWKLVLFLQMITSMSAVMKRRERWIRHCQNVTSAGHTAPQEGTDQRRTELFSTCQTGMLGGGHIYIYILYSLNFSYGDLPALQIVSEMFVTLINWTWSIKTRLCLEGLTADDISKKKNKPEV